jgi:hypothetical protein
MGLGTSLPSFTQCLPTRACPPVRFLLRVYPDLPVLGCVCVCLSCARHHYERAWPVQCEKVTDFGYANPRAPVHLLSGKAGINGQDEFKAEADSWNAYRDLAYQVRRRAHKPQPSVCLSVSVSVCILPLCDGTRIHTYTACAGVLWSHYGVQCDAPGLGAAPRHRRLHPRQRPYHTDPAWPFPPSYLQLESGVWVNARVCVWAGQGGGGWAQG